MSGHSKWSTIKHKKAATDAKKGAVFTKLARDVTIATREGGSGDPALNFRLRLIMDKAQANPGYSLHVDLESQRVWDDDEEVVAEFEMAHGM